MTIRHPRDLEARARLVRFMVELAAENVTFQVQLWGCDHWRTWWTDGGDDGDGGGDIDDEDGDGGGNIDEDDGDDDEVGETTRVSTPPPPPNCDDNSDDGADNDAGDDKGGEITCLNHYSFPGSWLRTFPGELLHYRNHHI